MILKYNRNNLGPVGPSGTSKKLIVGKKKRNEILFLFFSARMDFFLPPLASTASTTHQGNGDTRHGVVKSKEKHVKK
jgi:hypothetical protein